MDKGWIKLHRKFKGKAYYKKSAYVHLWVHCLLSANHSPREFMWNGKIIMVKAGQFIAGRKEISLETGIPESTVERILNMLESEHQIKQQKTTKYRLITIVNWDSHQDSDNKTNRKRTASGHKQELKNEKKNTIPEAKATVELKHDPLIDQKNVSEIIYQFAFINPACKGFYGIKVQRQACESLIREYGFERVDAVIKKTLPKTNKIAYFPNITTPNLLWQKWAALESMIIKERNKQKTEQDKKGSTYV